MSKLSYFFKFKSLSPAPENHIVSTINAQHQVNSITNLNPPSDIVLPSSALNSQSPSNQDPKLAMLGKSLQKINDLNPTAPDFFTKSRDVSSLTSSINNAINEENHTNKKLPISHIQPQNETPNYLPPTANTIVVPQHATFSPSSPTHNININTYKS